MLNELKRLDLDGADLDTLVAAAAYAENLQHQYSKRNVPTPTWLDDKARALTREITRRSADDLERQLKAIEAQQAALMTPAEKRDKLAKEAEELRRKLGLPTETTAAAPSGS